MKKYVCKVCGWIYDEALGDPDNGIAPGTKFEDLPADFVCPLCGVGKDEIRRNRIILAGEERRPYGRCFLAILIVNDCYFISQNYLTIIVNGAIIIT